MAGTKVRRSTAALAAAAVVAIAAGACSRGSDDQVSSRAVTPTAVADSASGAATGVVSTQELRAVSKSAAQPAPATAAEGAGGSSAANVGLPGSTLPQGLDQSKVVKTAVIHLEVKHGRFGKQFSEAATIASTYGGFVASSTSAAGDDKLDAGTLVIRVPAESFDKARNDLHRLGTVKREQLSGHDVGGQLADIGARLLNLGAQEAAIRGLMAKAKDVNETLTVQNQLSAVRQQIEELTAQQARLTDAVAYSTITVNLAEPGVETAKPDPTGLAGAWHDAVHGAAGVVGGTIVALGYLVPLALLAAAAAVLGRLAWRARPRPTAIAAAAAASAATEHGA
jgi:hypothetical protein